MRKAYVLLAVMDVLLAAALVIAAVMGGAISKSAKTEPGVVRLDLELPKDYWVSSYAAYHDVLVLCCYNESSFGHPDAFSLFSYRQGDRSFSEHPIDLMPYEARRTSLNVVDDKLYLFHTKAYGGEYTTYKSYIEEIITGNWTLGAQKRVYHPDVLAPGVQISDGRDLYILGGSASSTEPPYWPLQANDTVLKVDLETGRVEAMATIPGASVSNGVFLGNDLLLMRTGSSGGAQPNFARSVEWNSTLRFDMTNRTLTVPEGISAQLTMCGLPASGDGAVYVFNPYQVNTTSWEGRFAQEVWKMNASGVRTVTNSTLPEDLNDVVPIRFGDGFFIISFLFKSYDYWFCTLEET